MIISRTPFRISFFGGGTDYHTWYQNHGAALLTSAINHYCYISCRLLPPFFSHKSRIVWSQIEKINEHKEIIHPAIKTILNHLEINDGIEIQHQGDLPARSGLGSSSAFTVGLINALYAMHGSISTKKELACEAVYAERHLMKENVGVQDQIQTAYGGINKINIQKNGEFEVHPLCLSETKIKELTDYLLLFYTGISRTASEIACEKIKSIPNKTMQMQRIYAQVDEAVKILTGTSDITQFGELLDEGWQLKKQISNSISTSFIDQIYEDAKKSGAIGGKLLGAGGGGFILLFAKPENHNAIKNKLGHLLHVPFTFDFNGSTIIYAQKIHSKILRERLTNLKSFE